MHQSAVYLVTTENIGSGDETLGAILMRSFIKSLVAADRIPAAVLLLNGGVRLAAEGSELIDDLKQLVSRGTEVLACGTCLDFFNIKDRLQVGQVGNMARTIELLNAHPSVTVS